MNIFKEKFKHLQIIETIENINTLNNKAFNKSNKLIEKTMISFISWGMLTFVSTFFHNAILSVSMLTLIIIPFLFLVGFIVSQNKIMNYFKKKYGHDYCKNELIDILKNQENQKIIVNYFNNDNVHDKDYLIINEQFKLALSNNNYEHAITSMNDLINRIKYNENQLIQINELKEKNEIYQKQLGIKNIEVEQELEIGNLKKYL